MAIKTECVYCMGPNFDIKLSSDELVGFKRSFKSSFISFKILFRTHFNLKDRVNHRLSQCVC